MKILKIKKISKKFNNKYLFKDVNLIQNKGEIISIIGPSGIGKTTLLKCITGLEKINRGRIIFQNKLIAERGKYYSNKTGTNIGIVFQGNNLFPNFTVSRNITEALVIVKRIDKNKAIKVAIKLLKSLNLKEKINSYPFELSQGQAQRVAIIRALALKPKLLLLDEPTSSLDPYLKKEVVKIIKNLSKKGISIIVSSHEVELFKAISDQVFILNGSLNNILIRKK
jgi:ABC-type polar amino acid transport system ATPase subunit